MTAEDSTPQERHDGFGASPSRRESATAQEPEMFGVLDRRAGLLGSDWAGGHDGVTVRTGLLRPFTGVLGPWQPSTEGPLPRLSFLALPWLVREVHTTERERVVREERTTERTLPTEATPETTTVHRLLRTDEGESHEATATPRNEHDDAAATRTGEVPTEVTRTTETLRDVLRWRPVLIDRPAPWSRVEDRSDGIGTTPGTEPPTTRRAFRAIPEARANARGADGAGASERAGVEERTGRRIRTVDRSRIGVAVRTPAGSRGSTTRTSGIGAPADRRPSTGTRRPALLAGRASMTLRHPWNPHRNGIDGPAEGRGRVAGVDHRAESPTTATDAVPNPPVETDADSGPTPDDEVVSPVRLAYRRADGGGTVTTGGAPTPAAGTALREPVAGDPTAPSPVDARSLGASTTEEPSDAGGSPLVGRDGPPENPTSPFASFPSTEAAVEHVHREIERRLRIERERRGL
jgi:hypothetical protein